MIYIHSACDQDLLEPPPAVSYNHHLHVSMLTQYQQHGSPDVSTVSGHKRLPGTEVQSWEETDQVHEVLTHTPPFIHCNLDFRGQHSEIQGQDAYPGDEGNRQLDVIDNMFHNAYTDTVCSVASTTFLIQPSDHMEQDSAGDCEDIKGIYFNCSYTQLPNLDVYGSEQNYSASVATGDARCDLTGGDVLDREALKESQHSGHATHSAHPVQNIEEFVHQCLIPVADNGVHSLDINEIIPSSGLLLPATQCADVKSKLLDIDESFLLNSQSSIYDGDMVEQNKRAVTMQNLHERSSYVNLTNIEKMGTVCQRALVYLKDGFTFGSLISLNNIAVKHCSRPEQGVHLISNARNVDVIRSTKHRQNVIVLSISITLLFVAMGSVRNLQSSLNQEGGVGITSMAVSFVGYMLGSIFSSSIVQNFQPRKCIVVSLIPNLIYVAANIYPVMWLMTVVSLIQGISLAIIWNAMSTYITFLSRGYAVKNSENFEKVSSNFFGIFCLIYQSYHIIGNLIASLVLMPGAVTILANSTFQNGTANITTLHSSDDVVLGEFAASVPVIFQIDSVSEMSQNVSLSDSSNLSLCGAAFCNHFEVNGSRVTVSTNTKYLLVGIYMGCIVVSIGVAAFLLEPLHQSLLQSTASSAQKVKIQLISLATFSIDGRFLLLLPLLMYSFMQFGFISGEVTMAFVTCPLGIHMVGYMMICFGVTCSISSYISGILCRYTGRVSQIITASVLNLAILVSMTYWQPTSGSLIPYFCVIGMWGVGDGIWNCQVNSIMGVVFSDRYEEAYTGLRVAQGLGAAILFSYSNLVCMTVKIYLTAGVCMFATCCYLIMEVVLKYRITQKLAPVKQTSV